MFLFYFILILGIALLEPLILVLVFRGFGRLAGQRGGRAAPFVAIAVVGFSLIGLVLHATVGALPALVGRWLWIAMVRLSMVRMTGGGLRLDDTWQCPDCTFFNDRDTLVCACGHRPEAARHALVPAADAARRDGRQALVIGALGCVAWIMPIAGMALGAAGISLAIGSLRTVRSRLAWAALALNAAVVTTTLVVATISIRQALAG